MKMQAKKIIMLCALAGAFSSCDMDVVPPAEISAENFWKTEKDAWYALNGCYQSMPALDIWDEMCTDNAHSHKPWEGNMEMVQQNGINTASPYGDYDFSAIRTANTFISRVETCDMSEELKERMKAEARFFRAFAYLELTQYFGKVAIVTEELPYDAPNVPRNSLEEVRSFILDELAQVAEILPESYNGSFLYESGRVTKYAALALRARAALYFGNYAEAEKSAKASRSTGTVAKAKTQAGRGPAGWRVQGLHEDFAILRDASGRDWKVRAGSTIEDLAIVDIDYAKGRVATSKGDLFWHR